MTTTTKPWRVCQAGRMAQRVATEDEARQLATVLSMAAVNEQSNLSAEKQQTAAIWAEDEDPLAKAYLVATYHYGRDIAARRQAAQAPAPGAALAARRRTVAA